MLQFWNTPVVRTDSFKETQGSNPTKGRFFRFFFSCKRFFSWGLVFCPWYGLNERSILRFSSRVGAHLVFPKFALEDNVIPHQWQVCGIFRHKNSSCNDNFKPRRTAQGTVGRFQIFCASIQTVSSWEVWVAYKWNRMGCLISGSNYDSGLRIESRDLKILSVTLCEKFSRRRIRDSFGRQNSIGIKLWKETGRI